MRDLRAVVYGVGAMGSILTRLLLDKGVKIVGAVGRSPEKVGRDLGDVAGLGRKIGVAVDSDPHRALAGGADIAVVCVSSYLSNMRDIAANSAIRSGPSASWGNLSIPPPA